MVEGEVQEARVAKVGVLSLANTLGIINVFGGFVFGLISWGSSSLISSVISSVSPLPVSLNINLIYLLVFFPLLYGILGWITGLIGGLFYNLTSKITKGIKLYSS